MNVEVCVGDLISLVDSRGGCLFAAPSLREPLPENKDRTSHLRVIRPTKEGRPVDFSIRCAFQILGEKKHSFGNAVTYGSFIRLVHCPTGNMVVGSSDDDPNNESGAYSNVYFKQSAIIEEEAGSLWEVLPRYHLHADGDAVQAKDHIVLRNYLLKDKILMPVFSDVGIESSEDLAGLVIHRGDSDLPSWHIHKLLLGNDVMTLHEEAPHRLRYHMFLRLRHIEANGYLIARNDDAWARGSEVAVLSLMFHVATAPTVVSSRKVCVRSRAAASAGGGTDSTLFDDGASRGVWQVLPAATEESIGGSRGDLRSGDAVRLYNLQTSSFLSCRLTQATAGRLMRSPNFRNTADFSEEEKKFAPSEADDDGGHLSAGRYELCLSTEPSSINSIFNIYSGMHLDDFTRDPHNCLSSTDRISLRHQATGVVVALADQTSDYHADAAMWPEYRHDYPLHLCSSEPAEKEVFDVEVVGMRELSEILYLAKFVPLVKAGVVELQMTNDLRELFLPLYRHLGVGIYSLIRWVHEQVDASECLLDHPTDPMVTRGRYSAMGPWVGRGAHQFDHRYFRNGIPSQRQKGASMPVKTARQNLISDSGILEILLFYTALVYRLMQEQLRRLTETDAAAPDMMVMHLVPPLVQNCCVLVQDLLEVCCRHNARNAVRILALPGIGLLLMEQQILGWNVPIETLLLSSKEARGNYTHTAANHAGITIFPNNLTQRDILNFLVRAHTLLLQGDATCIELLRLLTVLFSHTDEMVKQLCMFAVDAIFGKETADAEESDELEESGVLDRDRLVHNTRDFESFVQSPGSSHHHRTEAGLMFFATKRFQDEWQVKFGMPWPVIAADGGRDRKSDKLHSLRLIWARIVTHNDRISANEAVDILQLLGVPATMIIRGTQELVNKTYNEFLEWWDQSARELSPTYIFESGTVKTVNISSRHLPGTFVPRRSESKSLEKTDYRMQTYTQIRESDSDDDSDYWDDDDSEDNAIQPAPAMAGLVMQMLQNAKHISSRNIAGTPGKSKRNLHHKQRVQSEVMEEGDNSYGFSSLLSSVLGIRQYEVPLDEEQKRQSLKKGLPVAEIQSISVVTMERTYRRDTMMKKIPGFDIGVNKPALGDLQSYDLGEEVGLLAWQPKHQLCTSWMPFESMLSTHSFEKLCFTEALALVCVLCSNNNLHAQRRASRIFPVSFVLHILENGNCTSDRAAACWLLRVLYVQHDLVSPLSGLTSTRSESYSLQENGRGKSTEWMLFNKSTRHPQAADITTASGRSLRFVLSRIVQAAFHNLSFTSTEDDEWLFACKFLELLHELMTAGFIDSSSNITSLKQTKGAVSKLTTESIGWGLIAKVGAYLEFVRSEDEADATVRVSRLLNYLNSPECLHIIPEYDRKRLQQCIQQMADVRAWGLDSEYLCLVNSYFVTWHNQPIRTRTFIQLMNILITQFEIDKFLIIKNMMSVLQNISRVFPDYSASKALPSHGATSRFAFKQTSHDIPLAETPPAVVLSSADKTLLNEIVHRTRDRELQRVEVVEYMTLFQNDEITRSAYAFLRRLVHRNMDLADTLRTFDFLPVGDCSILQRIGRKVVTNILKYFREWNRMTGLSSVDFRKNLIEDLIFSLLRILLYRSTRYEQEVDLAIVFSAEQSPRMVMDSEEEEEDEEEKSSYFDFYGQNLGPLLGTNLNTLRATALTTFYFPRCCNVDQVAVVKLIVSDLSLSVCELVLYGVNEVRPWVDLTVPEQYFIDRVLGLCASLCAGHRELVEFCIRPNLFEIAVKYEAQCTSSAHIIQVVMTFCTVTAYELPENFNHRTIKSLIVDIGELRSDGAAVMSRAISSAATIRAMLCNEFSNELTDDCMGDLVEVVLGHAEIQQCIVFKSELDSSELSLARYKLHLNLLLLLRELVCRSDMYNTPLCDVVPIEFCEEVLRSRSGSLQAKAVVMNLYYELHVRTCVDTNQRRDRQIVLLESATDEFIRIKTDCQAHRAAAGGFEYVTEAMLAYFTEVCSIISNIVKFGDTFSNEVNATLNAGAVPRNKKGYGKRYAGHFFTGVTAVPASSDPQATALCGMEFLFDCVCAMCELLSVHFNGVCLMRDVVNDDVNCHKLTVIICAMVMLRRGHVNSKVRHAGDAVGAQCDILESTLDVLLEQRDASLHERANAQFQRESGLPIYTSYIAKWVDNRRAKTHSWKTKSDVINDFGPHACVRSDDAMYLWLKEEFADHLSTAASMLARVEGDINDIFSGKMSDCSILRSNHSLSDFDMWNMGGGRYLCEMIRYLQLHAADHRETSDVPVFMLHLLSSLLQNKIYEMKKHTWREVDRVRTLQLALSRMGLPQVVVVLVSSSAGLSFGHDYIQNVIPVALKLGIRLMVGGNEVVQEVVMSTHLTGLQSLGSSRSKYGQFVDAIDSLLHHTTHVMNTTTASNFSMSGLKMAVALCDFCGTLCSGHNTRAQDFLRDQHDAGRKRNLVLRISKFIESLQHQLRHQIVYISYDQFYNVVAPCVWKTESFVKRRFIAWHDSKAEYRFICTVMTGLQFCLMSLSLIVQGPNIENQPFALAPVVMCADIFEYVGGMELQVPILTDKTRRLRRGLKGKYWPCSRPRDFLLQYRRVMSDLDLYGSDPDAKKIDQVIAQSSTNTDVLQGVGCELFFAIANELERVCLRYVLALLEASSDLAVDTVLASLKGEILMQNMDNMYKISFRQASLDRGEVGKLKTTAVAYLTLVSTLAYGREDNPLVMLDDLLRQWLGDTAREGFPTDKLIASVEIVSKDSRLQTIYFPIPRMVLRFWQFTEVEKAKDLVLQQVNRESAEDKIMSFYYLMRGIENVMHRQDQMRKTLKPTLHALIGGSKPFVGKSHLFSLRSHLHMTTMLLCFNFTVKEYMGLNPWLANDSPVLRFIYAEQDEHFVGDMVTALQILHIILSCVNFLRFTLNSTRWDNVPSEVSIYGRADDYNVEKRGQTKYWFRRARKLANLVIIMLSECWAILVVACSLLGISVNPFFYSPVLLDIIPDVRILSFIITAINRNRYHLVFTVVLAVLFLYLVAVFVYWMVPNQYNLGGHSDCHDIVRCFKLHLDYGLFNSPDWIGEGVVVPQVRQYASSSARGFVMMSIAGTLFNFIYILMINLVLQAIISGLIIDAFSELRDENESIQRDTVSKCFICSIDRDDFEKYDVNYPKHIKREHNMWHYFWFYLYIKGKNKLDYTGPEKYIFSQFSDGAGFVHTVPIKRSWTLERRRRVTDAVPEQSLPANVEKLAESVLGVVRSSLSNQQKQIDIQNEKMAEMADLLQQLLDLSKSNK